MSDVIEPWHYFTSPVYNFKKPEFLKSAKEVCMEKLAEVKKTTKYKREGEDIVESRDVVQSILFEKEVCFEKDEVNLKEDPAVIKWSGI